MLASLEQQGYDVVYSTNLDTHESPAQLLLHKAFLSVGHDEYWSYEMRQNVTAALNQGVNLGFFSADTSNWQIRLGAGSLMNRWILTVPEVLATRNNGTWIPDAFQSRHLLPGDD